MNEPDFDERLRVRLHERFDKSPSAASRKRLARDWPRDTSATATPRMVIAAVLLVAAVAVAGSVGRWLLDGGAFLSVGGTPSPTETAFESMTPIPAAIEPTGNVPAVTRRAWNRLALIQLNEGPVRISSVTAWIGGYVALAQTPNFSRVSDVWRSRDGRNWVVLPKETLAPPGATVAAPCLDGILVVTRAAGGETTARYSVDGVTWTPTAWPEIYVDGETVIAGNDRGVIAIAVGSPNRLLFSRDCSSWNEVDLPGSGLENVTGVATYRETLIAVGNGGNEPLSPVAWSSPDGVSWTPATIRSQSVDGFRAVYAGNDGLVARGIGEYGKGSYWTSRDGTEWNANDSNPLRRPESPDSMFVVSANGTRLLGRGSQGLGPEGGLIEYWTSFDGVQWTKLEVSGPDSITQNWATQPFAMRDGVLFSLGQSDPAPAWFAVAGS